MIDREFTSEQLARINDALRANLVFIPSNLKRDGVRGQLMLTRTVADLPAEQMRQLFMRVAAFNDFTEENNPHGERDFGSIELFGERWFWKFDYYDENLEAFGHAPIPLRSRLRY